MKLTLNLNQRAFFTSDSHYGHHNMCSGISRWKQGFRNYRTLEEMNDALVDGINSVVREDDLLFHIGDWSFGGIENIWEFRKRIRCKNVHIVLGNHDEHIELNKVLPNCRFSTVDGFVDSEKDHPHNVRAQQLFASVHDRLTLELVIPDENGKTFKKRFELSHYPFCSWKSMNQGVIHLHGRVHLPDDKKVHEGRSMDVGVDGNAMVPYMLQEISQIMRERPIRYTTLVYDHHESNHDDEIRETKPKVPKVPKPGRPMHSDMTDEECHMVLTYITSVRPNSTERDELMPKLNEAFKSTIRRIYDRTKLVDKLDQRELNEILISTLFGLQQTLENVRLRNDVSEKIVNHEDQTLACGNYFSSSARSYIFGSLQELNKKLRENGN